MPNDNRWLSRSYRGAISPNICCTRISDLSTTMMKLERWEMARTEGAAASFSIITGGEPFVEPSTSAPRQIEPVFGPAGRHQLSRFVAGRQRRWPGMISLAGYLRGGVDGQVPTEKAQGIGVVCPVRGTVVGQQIAFRRDVGPDGCQDALDVVDVHLGVKQNHEFRESQPGRAPQRRCDLPGVKRVALANCDKRIVVLVSECRQVQVGYIRRDCTQRRQEHPRAHFR